MAETNRQVAFLFQEAGDLTAEVVGGKAASLAAMTQMGLPVPPGFVVSTGVCRAFLEHGAFPVRLGGQIERCVKALECQTGKRFGSHRNPLLVSVRSGAPLSMPGMMDTILNLGVTKQCLPALQKTGGEKFAADTWYRFQNGFQAVVGCEAPGDVWQQLHLAMAAVCRSWQSERAREYRKKYAISDLLGTAVTVQAMTFGNLTEDSGTGVVFSRNVATGEPELYGEFLPCAQGEDVVGGGITPLPIAKLAEVCPAAFRELAGWVGVLESHYGDIVDIEYTLEAGRLWILQCRKAKRTPTASARFAVQAVWEGKRSKAEAVSSLDEEAAEALERPGFEKAALEHAASNGQFFARGLPAAPGAVVGKAVFEPVRAKDMASQGERVILFRQDTNPDDLPGMMASVALVTATGGATSHAAVVARALGIPAVVGCSGVSINGCASAAGRVIREGDLVAVEGGQGLVLLGGVPFSNGSHSKEISIFLKWLYEIRPPRPKPQADFTAIERRLSANQLLNDFYLADAMASASVGTQFYCEAKKLRRQVTQEVASTLAAYLCLACAGELRHTWKSVSSGERPKEQLHVLTEKFGLLPGSTTNRRGAQLAVMAKLRELGLDAQCEFLQLAVQVFNAPWPGGNYGGKKWAAIAHAALEYLSGAVESAVFVDHVFDLRHNGGKLFDKHPMVSEMTNEDSLRRQLDLKKSVLTIEALEEGLRKFWTAYSPAVSELWQKGKGVAWCRAGGTP